MPEPTPGPAHRREYVDAEGHVALVDVDEAGLVVVSAELIEQLLIELGYERKR